MELLKTNSFKLVGRLTNCNLEPKTKDNGDGYITGTATIVSTLEGRNYEFEVRFYTNKLTKDKKESQLYTSYSKMHELIGKNVEVSGEFREIDTTAKMLIKWYLHKY